MKKDIKVARREYVKGLHTLVENCTLRASKDCANEAGNCSEFVAWGAICKGGETYRSLWLNVNKDKTYKCCNHCELLAKATWKGKSIRIEDWFDETSLKIGPSTPLWNGYVACDLKSIQAIIAEGRGRRVRRCIFCEVLIL